MSDNALLQDDQEWFWTEPWQSGERQAFEEIAAGGLSVFDGIDAMSADCGWGQIPCLAESHHDFHVATDHELADRERYESETALTDTELVLDAMQEAVDATANGELISDEATLSYLLKLREEEQQAGLDSAMVSARGERAGDEVAAGARRVLDHIERLSGGEIPGLRRHVADVLAAARRRDDDDQQRVRAVLVILRPVLDGLAELAELDNAAEFTEEVA